MFEKIGQSAETLVSRVSVSRRGFLRRAAKVAAGLGAVVAGLAAFPTEAQASRICSCCWGPYCFGGYTRKACREGGGVYRCRRPHGGTG